MRSICILAAIAAFPALVLVHAYPASAQNFDERWLIIPKAHADPAPQSIAPDELGRPEQSPAPAQPSGNKPSPQSSHQVFSGKASFYSYPKGKTASGEPFDRDELIAAHRTLPFGTKVKVTDIATQKSVVVRIVDRGPWVKNSNLVIDLSLGAARDLGITDRGVAEVQVEVL
jgi:rare lipoprotein A